MSSPAPAPAHLDDESRRSAAEALRNRLVLVLAVTSGATDALGFLALGSAFTSVMTGNMVLLGVAAADRDVQGLILCAVAIGAFVTGAALGARVAGHARPDDPVWPKAVTTAMLVEFVLFALVAAGWWANDSHPPQSAYLPMLAAASGALGLQSSAIQRFGVSGLSTTYLTGTLTTVVIKLTHGHGFRAVAFSCALLMGLVVGAAAMTALVIYAPTLVPLLILLTLGVVLATVWARREVLHR